MIKRSLITMIIVSFLVAPNFATVRTVMGRITFVGTIGEKYSDGVHQATFRIRLSESTCAGDDEKKERWIHVDSGRMSGELTHNLANFRNAYSTVLTALVAKKYVQIDGVPSCNADSLQTIDLWSSQIGVISE